MPRHRHGRGADGRHAAECLSEELAIGCPTLNESRSIAEPIQKALVVFREKIIEEPVERGLGRPNLFAGHAAACVQGNAEAYRHALRAEMRDRLRLVIFVHQKVFLQQTRDEPAGRVRHHRRDVDQLDATLEAKPRLWSLRWRRLLLGGR